ncbi:glycosyltransferase family 25 protein [Pukyongiella litopenaei]|uniref:Glycosyltransferase family 25 protein n=1 Tax=Pukyongiella litopenaei TaxID=2605946 RepID=A0A2S0MPI1_9RHOB|nr:glycosyltransferase family 25 protein [Pukyongiella litopenaei]AVO37785.1 glycosyltransferase family 25 protein [Pukyongiella litopenaei]
MQSFVIHMKGSDARRPNAERLCAELPDAQLVDAVNGRDPDAIADMRTAPGTLHAPRYPFPLRPAEIGVFLSHRKCWQRIVDGGVDFALIAEDDLAVDPERFARALELIGAYATPGMYVRLPVKQREKPARVIAETGGMRFILPRVIGLQTVCQVVGREVARRLLAATETIDRPVDTLLQMHWVTGQPVHAILPNGNREITGEIGGSTIQTRTPAAGKFAREVKRAAYRAQVALRPQRA